jgi:hypothetical protein
VAELGWLPGRGEPPPFGRSWGRLYLAVLANLAFWIAVMALTTWAFS